MLPISRSIRSHDGTEVFTAGNVDYRFLQTQIPITIGGTSIIGGSSPNVLYHNAAGLIDEDNRLQWDITIPSLNAPTFNGLALFAPSFDNQSVSVGAGALASPPGVVAGNTAVGFDALGGALTSAAVVNVALGFQAGAGNTSGLGNFYCGFQAGIANTTGIFNVFFGYQAGFSCVGSNNTYIGFASGFSITGGSNSVILGSWFGPASVLNSAIVLATGGTPGTLELDYNYTQASTWTIASGTHLRLGDAYVATPQVSSGYITVYDNTGTAYKVLVST